MENKALEAGQFEGAFGGVARDRVRPVSAIVLEPLNVQYSTPAVTLVPTS